MATAQNIALCYRRGNDPYLKDESTESLDETLVEEGRNSLFRDKSILIFAFFLAVEPRDSI